MKPHIQETIKDIEAKIEFYRKAAKTAHRLESVNYYFNEANRLTDIIDTLRSLFDDERVFDTKPIKPLKEWTTKGD